MHLIHKTPVEQQLTQVWAGFNRKLFEQLTPTFPPVKVVRFDGCLRGDIVHLQLNFFLLRQDWISHIVDQNSTEQEIYFIDHGAKLPFFLTYWHHRHRLISLPNDATGLQTLIVDDVTFRTPFRLTDYLVYPILWLQFACRKPVYKRVFKRT
ncbi:hypothetical protein IC229_06685 [Spirosoma sp. BT702]|uniref:Ligand-binding SRPBCC domain-containing protein n=1 Tax=Spirosoma profusum TaxID=2771354 RepID=A0A926XUA5_9BACT|nr:hypothetical protein [Spirosoma profusum]MBD2700312.1 hypothetical protein [Spirosoma profusum]